MPPTSLATSTSGPLLPGDRDHRDVVRDGRRDDETSCRLRGVHSSICQDPVAGTRNVRSEGASAAGFRAHPEARRGEVGVKVVEDESIEEGLTTAPCNGCIYRRSERNKFGIEVADEDRDRSTNTDHSPLSPPKS